MSPQYTGKYINVLQTRDYGRHIYKDYAVLRGPNQGDVQHYITIIGSSGEPVQLPDPRYYWELLQSLKVCVKSVWNTAVCLVCLCHFHRKLFCIWNMLMLGHSCLRRLLLYCAPDTSSCRGCAKRDILGLCSGITSMPHTAKWYADLLPWIISMSSYVRKSDLSHQLRYVLCARELCCYGRWKSYSRLQSLACLSG